MVDGRDRMEEIRYRVEEHCFTTEPNRIVWRALCQLFDTERQIDRMVLAGHLVAQNRLDSIGGVTFLAYLDSDMPAGLALESHLRIVQEKSTLRRAALALNAALDRMLSADAPSGELIAYAQDLIETVAQESSGASELESAAKIIETIGWNEFCLPSRQFDGVACPECWPLLSKIIPSFRNGHLIVLAARTSVGKSALALHVALDAALRSLPVAVYTFEMSKREWLERAACHMATVDSYKHQNRELDRVERSAFNQSATVLAQWEDRLFFYDKGSITVNGLISQVKRNRVKPRMIIVDYLQLMKSQNNNTQRNQAVSEISRSLKRLATTVNVPVIALSQFNRDNAKDNREPELHDLKESGDIENDANIVVFVHPKGENSKAFQPVDVIVKKHRGGRLGRVSMMFEKPYSKFVEEA